jgi:hypothetical protein
MPCLSAVDTAMTRNHICGIAVFALMAMLALVRLPPLEG